MNTDYPIANPGDYDATFRTSLFLMWAGAYGDTRLFVWADSFEDAFEHLVEYLDDHAPGLLCTVTEDDLREAASELGLNWSPDWPDFSDEAFCSVVDTAEADLTSIGHTTLAHGTHIPSWEWGGDDITDEATIAAVKARSAEESEAA